MDTPKDAGPLGLHFQKMLELKQWLKEHADKAQDDADVLKQAYRRMDELIKEQH